MGFEYYDLVDTMMTAGDMSTATLTSTAIFVPKVRAFSIQAVFTGAPVGELKLQTSNDGTNWTDLADSISTSVTAISAAGSIMYNVHNHGFTWVRGLYTKTSGTGTMGITIRGR
jgi:hypothetical protein